MTNLIHHLRSANPVFLAAACLVFLIAVFAIDTALGGPVTTWIRHNSIEPVIHFLAGLTP